MRSAFNIYFSLKLKMSVNIERINEDAEDVVKNDTVKDDMV